MAGRPGISRELEQLRLYVLEVRNKLAEPPAAISESQVGSAIDVRKLQARQKLERIAGSLKESSLGLQVQPLDRIHNELLALSKELQSIPEACAELQRIADELKKIADAFPALK